jgi:hypothetical protein
VESQGIQGQVVGRPTITIPAGVGLDNAFSIYPVSWLASRHSMALLDAFTVVLLATLGIIGVPRRRRRNASGTIDIYTTLLFALFIVHIFGAQNWRCKTRRTEGQVVGDYNESIGQSYSPSHFESPVTSSQNFP